MIIRVFGEPKAQPRPRRSKSGHFYNPASSQAWKDAIIAEALKHKAFFGGGVELEITYYLKRPKSLMRIKDSNEPIPHFKKPDLDNLNKTVMDALTMAKIWRDDCYVQSLYSKKYYASKDNSDMGAIIILRDKR